MGERWMKFIGDEWKTHSIGDEWKTTWEMNENLKTGEFLQKKIKVVRKAEKTLPYFFNHLSLDYSRNKRWNWEIQQQVKY